VDLDRRFVSSPKICEKCAKDLEKHDASRAENFLDTAQKLQALTEE
jgi:hypothetical protein